MGKRGRPPYPGLLTPREQEVLDLVRARRTNPEISERLGISVETVKQHVSEILSKLGVATREEAAVWGEERHWTFGHIALGAAGVGVMAAAIAGLALLAWGLSRASDGEDEPRVLAPTAHPTQPAAAPTASVGDAIAACRRGLAEQGEPDTPEEMTIWTDSGVSCWQAVDSADLYLVTLWVNYWADCEAWRDRMVLDPVIDEQTLEDGVTWAALPPTPDLQYPHANYISTKIAAIGPSGLTVGNGRFELSEEIDYPAECEGSPPGTLRPAGAWSDCPTISADELPAGVHVMDAATCQMTYVADVDDAYGISWSPDGEYVAFLRLQGNILPANRAPSDLFLARSDGSEVRQLTDSPGIREWLPEWSPDGTRIAFSVTSLTDDTDTDLMVWDLASSQSSTLASDLPCLEYTWAADSDRMALSAGCGYEAQYVMVLTISTGGMMPVPGVRSVLAVAPEGDAVSYKCDPPQEVDISYTGVCMGSVDDPEVSPPVTASSFPELEVGLVETEESAILAYDAIWTPDGNTLAFVGQSYRALFLLPADGSPGRVLNSWTGSFLHWASEQVVVTMDCHSTTGIIPCGPYGLTSTRLDTLETRVALLFGCGSAGGAWSPDGSRLAISSATVGACL